MIIDLTTLAGRKWIADFVDNPGEKGRKYESFKQWEIYSDRIRDYVINDLKEQYDEESIKEIPVQSSINLAKRITDEKAVVYKHPAERDFTELNDEQKEKMHINYEVMRVDKKLASSNKAYVLQDQNHLWVIPKKGKLILRTLKNHQLTVIPDPNDPEGMPLAYVVVSFNKDDFLDQDNEMSATGFTAKVDQFDTSKQFQQRENERENNAKKNLIVWTREFNFSIDLDGNLTSEVLPNPLAEFGLMPFVDVSTEKEFEYWVRKGTGVTDFTIQFNKALSDVSQVVKMQGFSQAVLKGNAGLITSNVKIGPTYLLKILTDQNKGIDGEFKYVNPNSDIRGSLDWLQELLSYYLTSRAIDPKTVTASGETVKATSGLDRLLQMIQQITASMEDFETYERVEDELYQVIKAWITVLSGTDGLDDEYQISNLPEKSQVIVKYKKPEMIQSETETLANAERKIDIGLSSKVNEYMKMHDCSREKAIEDLKQFSRDELEIEENEQGNSDEEEDTENNDSDRNDGGTGE